MCVVSMIGDHYQDKFKTWPNTPWDVTSPYTPSNQPTQFTILQQKSEVSKEDFDKLKAEVAEMKELLKKALKYDEQNNQPECHNEEKWKFLSMVAEYVGVDLPDILDKACRYDDLTK